MKYSMLSTHWSTLRATLFWGSACVFWYLEEIKEVQWLYASDGLNCAYQLTTKSRYRSGEWLFPSCLQWQGLSQCMNILKTPGIEHLMHPVILTKTHSRLYSDPAKLNEENGTSDLLINKHGKPPQKSVVVCGLSNIMFGDIRLSLLVIMVWCISWGLERVLSG